MHADVHLVGDLLVVQSLGDQFGGDTFDVGQAVPSGHGPGGRLGPVAAPHAELAEPAADAGHVGGRAGLLVSVDGPGEVADRLVAVAVREVQYGEVFCGGGPCPRVGVLRGGLG